MSGALYKKKQLNPTKRVCLVYSRHCRGTITFFKDHKSNGSAANSRHNYHLIKNNCSNYQSAKLCSPKPYKMNLLSI